MLWLRVLWQALLVQKDPLGSLCLQRFRSKRYVILRKTHIVLGTHGLAQRSPGSFGPGEPQSPQRVRPGVRKESKKSPKRLLTLTLFGLRGALFGDWAPRGQRPRTPFRTLLGLFWGSGPEGHWRPLCQAVGSQTLSSLCPQHILMVFGCIANSFLPEATFKQCHPQKYPYNKLEHTIRNARIAKLIPLEFLMYCT